MQVEGRDSHVPSRLTSIAKSIHRCFGVLQEVSLFPAVNITTQCTAQLYNCSWDLDK